MNFIFKMPLVYKRNRRKGKNTYIFNTILLALVTEVTDRWILHFVERLRDQTKMNFTNRKVSFYSGKFKPVLNS